MNILGTIQSGPSHDDFSIVLVPFQNGTWPQTQLAPHLGRH